jgi:hypothetical protein
MTSAEQVTEFEALRSQLLAVAYRLVGTVADAEDMVQGAWLRWDTEQRRARGEAIADLGAWFDAVVALLHPYVTFTGDSNGKAPTAVQVIHGPPKVSRFMFGLAQRYGPAFFTANRLARVNGELGGYTADPKSTHHEQPMVRAVQYTASSRTLAGSRRDAFSSMASCTALVTSSRG